MDKLTYQQPISIIKRASNKSKCEAIPLSENSSATHASTFHQQRTPITVLCSGHFLENFSETVANLGSGQWSRNNNESVVSGSCIIMCDSPVADFVGEDTNFVSAKEPELPAVPRVGKLDCSMTLLADKSTYNQVNHCLNVSMNAIIILQ